jgi:hypothetical protein
MVRGDVAVIPGNVEHEGFFPEETEVVDIFARSQIVAVDCARPSAHAATV